LKENHPERLGVSDLFSAPALYEGHLKIGEYGRELIREYGCRGAQLNNSGNNLFVIISGLRIVADIWQQLFAHVAESQLVMPAIILVATYMCACCWCAPGGGTRTLQVRAGTEADLIDQEVSSKTICGLEAFELLRRLGV
jgi:hypothetical protein